MASKPTQAQVDQAKKIIARSRRDPSWFLREILGLFPWEKQAEIVEAWKRYDKLAVYSSNCVGKSYLAAGLGIHSTVCHPNTFTITTGASWTGVEKALWGSIHRLAGQSRIPLGGRLLDTEWKFGPQWGMFGVSTKVPANFAGFRTERGAIVIVDEASALPQDIMDAIEGLCAAEGSKIMLIGNPLVPEGPFYDIQATAADGWSLHSISAFDSPNVKSGKNLIPGLATAKWVEDMRAKWGEGSPSWMARVEGKFPESVSHQVVPLAWLKEILITERPARVIGVKRMGVDVARFGDDDTSFVVRDDYSTIDAETHHGLRNYEVVVAAQKFAAKHKIPPEEIYVDGIGVGSGVVDEFDRVGWCVQDVNSAREANDRLNMYNLRSEMHWRTRQALDPSLLDGANFLGDPRGFKILTEHAACARQLTWARYSFDSSGRIQVEAKEKIKERHGRSPDRADALQLTFSGAGMEAA